MRESQYSSKNIQNQGQKKPFRKSLISDIKGLPKQSIESIEEEENASWDDEKFLDSILDKEGGDNRE